MITYAQPDPLEGTSINAHKQLDVPAVIEGKPRGVMILPGEVSFQSIIDTSSDSIIIVDRKGVVQFTNPAAEAMFDRPAAELVGSMFGFPVVAGEITELDIVRRTGEPCIVEMRVVEMKWGEDAVHLATLRDVTERKLLELEIRQRNSTLEQRVDESEAQVERLNERLRVIFNTTNDAIALIDRHGHIDVTNPAFFRHFGYTPEEVMHQPLSMIAAGQYREELEHLIQHVVASGTVDRSEVLACRKDGTNFDVEISLSRVINNEGHLVCNLHDVSHYKSVERMKDSFMAMVSHELRTPIATTILSIDIVQNYLEKMSPDQLRKKMAQCREQVGVLKELVEGILETSEVDARERRRGSSPVVVHETLERVINELKPTAIDKRQVVTYFPNEKPIVIPGNSLDFTRIWRNLISNAIKYTPQGGKIFVRLVRLEKGNPTKFEQCTLRNKPHLESALDLSNRDYLIGQVEDTGHGIRPEDFDTLFQRFNRGWAETSGIPGTGLGLSLVNDLLTIYEGNIHVSSEIEKGSIFTFWLPL
ncbi:MAG: PAS domain S-box protein [Anaerolineae bacterium]|nr:PAS domain S-box protein [Anaerolineae bacterium]